MGIPDLHLLAGWSMAFLGVLLGAGIGLFFHREDWAGGYASFRRRMLRLAHISFFGLGILNILFGLTLKAAPWPVPWTGIASAGFLVGAVTMPLCCLLTAWKRPFRHLFPVPVLSVLAGIVPVLLGWASR
jgi:hypothetical protein